MREEWKEEAQELEKTVWLLHLSPYTEAPGMGRIRSATDEDPVLTKLEKCVRKGFMDQCVRKELSAFSKIFSALTISNGD